MATSSPQAAIMSSNHRASRRVRKQPQMYTSSPFTSSGKRKRSNEQDANGDHDLPEDYPSEESEDDAEDDEPDEEELREQQRKARRPKSTAPKLPAQKKPKVNGATLPFRSASTTKRRAPKKAKAIDVANAQAAGGLFAEVFASGATLEDVAGQWLVRFSDRESSALAEVVNFVLKCAGSEGEVSDSDIEDPDGVTNKLDDLREEYQASNPTDYPLIAKGKAATPFRLGMTGFFRALIHAMAVKSVLYTDLVLMENLQIWISTMSSAPNRSFRHTATVVSLAIVTALCQVARENAESAANIQRQAETERKKSSANKARVKQIEASAREKTQALEIIEPLLKDWFDVVFIHRYRDVDPIIRRDCMVALGDWIVTMPDVFFDGQHLRYLGWVLSDSSPATRGEVLKQLHRLYKEKDMLGGLKTFTEKFRARMVEIATTDAETNVRVSGVELLDLLRENGLLEPDDIDAVGRLVFDTDPKVRKAVAAFFSENINDLCNAKIDDLGGMETLEEALPEVGEDNYEAPRVEWLKFKSLAESLQSYHQDENIPSQVERSRVDGDLILHLGDGSSRFSLAADVLYDKVDEIKEWQMLAGYLLFDHSPGRANGVADDPSSQLKHECTLPEKEEMVLLEVLHASVRRTLAQTAEKIATPKGKLTKKAKEHLEEELEESVRHLVDLIPRLLKKYGDVPSTAAAVLRMEAVLSSSALKDLQQDSATYSALLDDVRKQFMFHSTDEVLAPASEAILRAKSYGELDEVAEEKITALWDDVISNLAELLNPATISIRGATSFEELTALSNNLLRIVRLSAVSDCVAPLEDSSVASSSEAGVEYQGAIDYIIALVERAAPSTGPAPDNDEAALEDEVAARAAEAALFFCKWKLRTIINAVTTGSNAGISLDELEALATRRDAYVANLESALATRKHGDDVSIHLTGCVLELYASAAVLRDVQAKPGVSDDYTVLVMDLTPELQKSIMQVFIASEKSFAKLSGKKLEDAPTHGPDVDQDALDDDPMSDPESEEDDDDEPSQTQASQQRRDTKIRSTLLAEQRLCILTGKIIHALAAGVMDNATVRPRMERNKARLGHNFKEVLAYLDFGEVQKKKAKARSKGKAKKSALNGLNGKAKAQPKSNAIVADDEVEDEIEDADGEDEEALRRRRLVDDDEPEPEAEGEAVNGAEADVESVIGD